MQARFVHTNIGNEALRIGPARRYESIVDTFVRLFLFCAAGLIANVRSRSLKGGLYVLRENRNGHGSGTECWRGFGRGPPENGLRRRRNLSGCERIAVRIIQAGSREAYWLAEVVLRAASPKRIWAP